MNTATGNNPLLFVFIVFMAIMVCIIAASVAAAGGL